MLNKEAVVWVSKNCKFANVKFKVTVAMMTSRIVLAAFQSIPMVKSDGTPFEANETIFRQIANNLGSKGQIAAYDVRSALVNYMKSAGLSLRKDVSLDAAVNSILASIQGNGGQVVMPKEPKPPMPTKWSI